MFQVNPPLWVPIVTVYCCMFQVNPPLWVPIVTVYCCVFQVNPPQSLGPHCYGLLLRVSGKSTSLGSSSSLSSSSSNQKAAPTKPAQHPASSTRSSVATTADIKQPVKHTAAASKVTLIAAAPKEVVSYVRPRKKNCLFFL